jgi:oligopeptide transport system substrate-binding protein
MNQAVDGMIYVTHLYEGLYRPNTDGSFSLGQASDVKITDNADGTAHVVATLRDDIFWSDGVPVKAQDFEYSWKRLCDPDVASPYGYIGHEFFANGLEVAEGTVTPDELSVTAVDEKTLEFDIVANVPYAVDLMAFPSLMPLREDIVSANPEGWATEAEGQVFNGRYTIGEFSHEDKLVLVKNDQYWDMTDKPTMMDTITFKLMDDDNAILAAFKNKELDLADSFPTDELAALEQTPEYNRYGNIGLYYIQFQEMEGSAPVLQDLRVRKALSLAIDRDYINETVYNNGRVSAYALCPGGIPDATSGSDFRATGGDVVGGDMTTDYAANLAKAKELLADAGYPDGEGFPTLEYSYNTNTGHQAVAEAIKQMWKENLGIDVTLTSMEWAVFQGYRKTTDCEIARQGWLGDYTDPSTFFDLFKSTAGTNDGHYNNPEYDALIDAARTESDPAVRAQKYHEAEAIIMNDMPFAPIVYYADDVLSQTNFSGFGVTGTGNKMFWDAEKAE